MRIPSAETQKLSIEWIKLIFVIVGGIVAIYQFSAYLHEARLQNFLRISEISNITSDLPDVDYEFIAKSSKNLRLGGSIGELFDTQVCLSRQYTSAFLKLDTKSFRFLAMIAGGLFSAKEVKPYFCAQAKSLEFIIGPSILLQGRSYDNLFLFSAQCGNEPEIISQFKDYSAKKIVPSEKACSDLLSNRIGT